ncbi:MULTISPECIES: BamA/TamA family outer membrane protein [unclassified Lentimicrobium]|uniref:Omp85 family outer membrane protein n=1 Tax=unclassified Lentimicrobium TaxID=2677434 RepID=UPI001555322C|nr:MULTISPECIES: BamA/TamA family outer membrane protein [unclassified Lentimicrobium]NPD46987.1 BamA/TamA family outer membrane protein [Lentimicrobium sp. S6]NPD83920.1 BamA/TamA family outer membrane protein [Lentimicrobium sp. L6]
MKRRILLLLSIALLAWPVLAQQSDSTKTAKIKKGWSFGALPVVSYDSDLGFQYGALGSIYHYGDGSRFPEYDHMFYVEGSLFTKGSGIFRFAYESDRLIKGVRINFDMSYIPDDAYDFIGFNGYESVYNQAWIDQDNVEDYISRMFYKQKRNMFRTRVDFQGKLAIKNLNWTGGVEFYNMEISSVNIDKFNKGKDGDDLLLPIDSMPGLYERYQEWGLIDAKTKDGGMVMGLKAGLVYDSRDNRAHPTKGIWTEAGLFFAPSFINDVDEGYLKFYLTHRQYFNIVKDRLTFAYRIGYQSSLVNKGPWYTDQLIITSALRGAFSEGLGGARSLRGIKRNRVVGDGIAYGNLELRWKVIYFDWFNQNFYIGLNGFLDGGQVVKLIPTEDQIAIIDDPTIDKEDYFDVGAESIHTSYGLGLKIAMNHNFIFGVDYGRVVSDKDGGSGIYIGLNYLF